MAQFVLPQRFEMANRSQIKWFDGFAMFASGLCLLHCIALPALIAMLPVVAKLTGATEALHLWLLIAALPTSLYALTAGARRSGRAVALAVGSVALTLLFLGWSFEGMLPYATLLTVFGSLLLAISHIANWGLQNEN